MSELEAKIDALIKDGTLISGCNGAGGDYNACDAVVAVDCELTQRIVVAVVEALERHGFHGSAKDLEKIFQTPPPGGPWT